MMKRKLFVVTVSIFVALTLWWVSIFFRHLMEGAENDYFAFIYPLVSLLGGIAGLFIAKSWGGYKSILGKALGAFALGLLGQAFGQLCYQITYIITHDVVPYPSIGDVGFFSTGIFYAYGSIQLMRATGVKVSLQSYKGRISALIIPVLWALASYFFFLRGYEFEWDKPIVVVLDLVSPIIDAAYLSLAILTYLLSRKVLGGLMKWPVLFLLIAVISEAVSDFTFLFLDSHYPDLIYPAAFNDYMYLVTYTLMALALMQLGISFNKLSEEA